MPRVYRTQKRQISRKEHNIIACGGAHVLIITADRRIAAFGLNRAGALGIGHTRNVLSKHYVQNMINVAAVDAGYEFSAALDLDGRVWAWGQSEYGQCGRGGYGVYSTATPLQGIPSIQAIACGGWHLLMQTIDGELWGCGCTAGGRTGMDGGSGPMPIPQRLGFGKVRCFAAGDFHSVIVTADGRVLECGRSVPITDVSAAINGEVVQIAAARDHTLALTDSGLLYSWGVNGVGQLGLGDHTSRPIPTFIPLPDELIDDPPVRIKSAYYVSMFITQSGKLYGWGSNDFGELGLPRREVKTLDRPIQIHLPADQRVCEVGICGCGGVLGAAVIALTTEGRVYTWGSSRHNQCGQGQLVHVEEPTELILKNIPLT